MAESLSTEYQLTWKREERDGRSYWHIYDRAGNRVRNIIGIEGQLIDEIERLTFIQKDFHNLEDVAEIKRLTAFIESEFFKRVTYKQENETLRQRNAWLENYVKACDNEIKRADERKRRWELEPPHCSTCSCEALPAQMLKPPDVGAEQK